MGDPGSVNYGFSNSGLFVPFGERYCGRMALKGVWVKVIVTDGLLGMRLYFGYR